MRIGVLTNLYKSLPFERALDKIAGHGLAAIEIGTGGYPGAHHCPLEELLESGFARQRYQDEISKREMFISAFSCHHEPLHPDEELAIESDDIFRKTVRLARMMEVPVVNVLSGIPAGAEGDSTPNWVTCPWPPHNLEILDYQWYDVAIPYWQGAAIFAEDQGVKIGMEMHPGMIVYNVETLSRLRDETGPALGCNFDPSHLVWNGVNPVAAIRALGETIVHVHGKDSYVDTINISVNGCNDHKPYSRIKDRAWTYRTIGYGLGVSDWKDIVRALRTIGYDYVISVEHKDASMSADEALREATGLLQKVITAEPTGEMKRD